MNIIVEKSLFLEGLKKVGTYVNNKGIAIFADVKVETVNNDTVALSATNGDTYITTEIHAQIVNNGSIVMNHKQVNDFLKKSKATQIEIETLDNYKVSIKAANIDYKVRSNEASEFPIAPNHNFDYITLDTMEYKRLINNTTYAVSNSDSRPVLKGVNVQTINGKLHFTATDSHRLGRYAIDTILENINVIPEGEALEKTLKITDKNTKEIKIGFNERHTLVQFDNTKIYVRNIEGNYPDTSRLIPDDFRTYATIKTSETLESLEMLHTVSSQDRNNTVRMELNGKIELKANAPEIGEMNALLTGKKHGEDLQISYSNLYMREALKAINENEVQLNFSGNMRPFTATSHDNKAIHLILPVRTK